MSELFEEDDEAANVDIGDEFIEGEDDLDIETEASASLASRDVDARRRLESMLDEKRLRDELDDFADY